MNMLKYIILFLPVLLFADNKKMHDEDPKNRPHNTLGFGVLGSGPVAPSGQYTLEKVL